jgi:putative ABC transport system ATP-binding protein
MKIKIKDLIKVYRTGKSEVIALRGLDMEIPEGELLVIMGPSGCGKTTLLNIIGGLDRPTAGSVEVEGVNIAILPDKELVNYRREKVGIVFQFFNLVPTLTAKENVELPMILAGKDSTFRKNRVTELLSLVGMVDRKDHKPDELSGGEQQRIAIATALANNPSILLADEPTGELDRQTGQQILELFQTLNKNQNITEIIVTHDLRISNIADRVLSIEDGRITTEIKQRT